MKNPKTAILIHFLLLSIVFLLVNCKCSEPLGVTHEMYQGYIPQEPIPTKTVEFYDDITASFIRGPWASLNDSTKITLLPIQSAQVSMRKVDMSGKISFMPASISHKKGNYEVIMDYMKYRVEDVVIDSTFFGSGRVGIGLRIKASVVTNKSDLNLSGLGKLGLEASKNNLSGYLSVDIVGVDSKDITNHIPLTAKLDETSIQYALQAIATIKSKIWDDDVFITPHLIAINQREKGSELIIKESVVNVGHFKYTKRSDVILNFIKPDGQNYNTENEDKLKEWMRNNNLDAGAGKITSFIYTKEMEALRKKAIKDLNLK